MTQSNRSGFAVWLDELRSDHNFTDISKSILDSQLSLAHDAIVREQGGLMIAIGLYLNRAGSATSMSILVSRAGSIVAAETFDAEVPGGEIPEARLPEICRFVAPFLRAS